MKNRQKLFSDILTRFAQESHCARRKVACLAVKDNRIIATGINGTPAGEENCDEHFKKVKDFTSPEFCKCHHEWSNLHEIHAEQAAISYAARNGIELDGCDIYCSLTPCITCTKLLAALKPRTVYYQEEYDKSDTKYIKDYFKKSGIKLKKL